MPHTLPPRVQPLDRKHQRDIRRRNIAAALVEIDNERDTLECVLNAVEAADQLPGSVVEYHLADPLTPADVDTLATMLTNSWVTHCGPRTTISGHTQRGTRLRMTLEMRGGVNHAEPTTAPRPPRALRANGRTHEGN